jgi:hypothetical protein
MQRATPTKLATRGTRIPRPSTSGARPVKIKLVPVTIAADTVQAYLVLAHDPAAVRAAVNAQAALLALMKALKPADLLRRAANTTDALEWLTRIAADAQALTARLVVESREAEPLLKADDRRRYQFDSAACALLELATQEEAHHRMLAAAAKAQAERGTADLAAAGLTPQQIAMVVGERGDGTAPHLAAAAAAATRARALGAFIADPRRTLDALEPALAEQLASRRDAMAIWPASIAEMELARNRSKEPEQA